jgi:serine/threonine protein kinase
MENNNLADVQATSSNNNAIDESLLLTPDQVQALKDFHILNEIGEGSFSTVYLASTKSKNMRCALKVCSKRKIQREKKVTIVNHVKRLFIVLGQASFSGARQSQVTIDQGKSKAFHCGSLCNFPRR